MQKKNHQNILGRNPREQNVFFLNLVVVYSDFKLRHLQSSEITYETDLPGSLSESEVDLSSFEARSTSKFSNE